MTAEVSAQSQLVAMLRRQLIRVHNALERSEARYRFERRERLQLEAELRSARDEAAAMRAGRASGDEAAAARELVEEAVAKAAAANRECTELRAELEEVRSSRADGDAAQADATSLRRALHNLSVSFEEQEHQLRSMLAEADAKLERHRATRARYVTNTQRMAETLRDLLVDLAQDEVNGDQSGGDENHLEEEEEEEDKLDENVVVADVELAAGDG